MVKSALQSDTGRKIGKAVKQQAIESSINLASDIANGKPIKDSLSDEFKNVKRNTKRKAVEIGLDHLKNYSTKPTATGRKKKTEPKNTKLKKRKKDIFS